MTDHRYVPTRQWRSITIAAAGLLLAIAGTVLFPAISRLSAGLGSNSMLLASYLVIWVPLGGAVVWAIAGSIDTTFGREFGFRFRPIDLLWGLSIGLLARAVSTIIQLIFSGAGAGSAPILLPLAHDFWWLFGSILAPVVMAPIIEEIYFRGLVLRSISRLTTTFSARVLTVAAIAVSSLTFSALHLLTATGATVAVVIGLSTLLFSVASAIAAIATGRLGASIVAHVTFNALVLLPALH